MKSRSTTSIAVAVTAALLLAACSSDKQDSGGSAAPSTGAAPGSSAAAAPVDISVASLIPGATKEATDEFNNEVKQFGAVYPNIHVKSVQYQWTGPTFTAKLAAGTLPTVFTVPFTDGRTLGENGQLADITTQAKALPYFAKYNPAVIAEGTTSDGKVIALPTAAYGQALHYNRKLFTQAGLDPNKPPTTWDEIAADAKQISQKVPGVAGYAEMGKNDNSAGWILTTLAYTLGGRMEDGSGTSAKATVDSDATKSAAEMLQKMRWDDKSMGSNFDYGWSDINQAFAAGKVGMYVSGADVLTNLVQTNKIDMSTYGITTVPLSGSDAAVLTGGTLAAVRPDASDAEKDAAVKWIDFYYEQKLIDKDRAVQNAKTLADGGQPVGVPALPIFDKEQYDLANSWIKPYINVPQDQIAPFVDKIFTQPLAAEPAASTQSVYHALDTVVQSILTQQGANIDALLKTANDQAQQLISQGK